MLANFNKLRSVFESLITEDNVVIEGNKIPIDYENVPESDSLAATKKNKSGPWCRLAIRDNNSFAVNIGNNQLQRFFGLVIVQIFVPKNQGTKPHREIADVIADLIKQEKYANGLTSRDIELLMLGDQAGDGWFQANISIGFEYDRQFEVFSEKRLAD